MARKRKPAARRALKRNPIARALRTPAFRQKVAERPDQPRRRPKHARPLEEDVED
jgi:hypothetical protein